MALSSADRPPPTVWTLEAALKKRLAWSGTATLAGIACSTAVDPTLGGWLTTLSVAALVWNLHRFGRTGAD